MSEPNSQGEFDFAPLLDSPARRLTFADLIALAPTWTDYSLIDRRDMVSAATLLCERVLRLPPEAVPCDPGWLNLRVYSRAPGAFGMTKPRFQNVMSKVRKALRRLGVHQPEIRSDAGISSAFMALLQAIPTSEGLEGFRAGLRGPFRYWSQAGLRPEDVSDDRLTDYAAFDLATRLSTSALRRAQGVGASWNRCVKEGFPNQRFGSFGEQR